MQATVDGRVVAQSDDVIECKGYQYFPRAAVRMDWLEKIAKTESDLACPHGVQFYDVVVGGHASRARRLVLRGAAAGNGPGRRTIRLLAGRRSRLKRRSPD